MPSTNQWPGLELQPETRALVHDWPTELLAGGANFWDTIEFWRGAEAVLTDMADRPDHTRRIIDRLVTAYLGMLDQMEALGLLGHSMSTIHCTPAWTDELPHDGFDPERPRAEDLWTMGMAQVFTSASPAMFKEYEIPYTVRWYERFGLGYYGCCDVLDRRVDIIREIPHVRKISMCPWANVDRGADAMGHDFVCSRKPNPALLAMDGWEPEAVEKDLRASIDTCRRTGTPLERSSRMSAPSATRRGDSGSGLTSRCAWSRSKPSAGPSRPPPPWNREESQTWPTCVSWPLRSR